MNFQNDMEDEKKLSGLKFLFNVERISSNDHHRGIMDELDF